MACLRKILGVARRDRLKNTQIREYLKYRIDLTSTIGTKKPKYFGHIKRMRPTRYPKILLEGNVEGNRPKGRPPKKWLDEIKSFTEELNIPSVAAAGHLASNGDLRRRDPLPGGHLRDQTREEGFKSSQYRVYNPENSGWFEINYSTNPRVEFIFHPQLFSFHDYTGCSNNFDF